MNCGPNDPCPRRASFVRRWRPPCARAGFTLIEVLVAFTCLVIMLALIVSGSTVVRGCGGSMKDATQIRQIHSAFLIFAGDVNGVLPTPGLINRLPVPLLAPAGNHTDMLINLPGVGQEHYTKNHTRHLYSSMIAQRFFNPDLVIGPTEVSDVVVEYTDYDYDQYDPASDIYWDGDSPSPDTSISSWHAPPDFSPPNQGFMARIDGVGPPGGNVCHTSYAHLAICGQRRIIKWRNTQSENDPILGTRGTGGTYEGASGVSNTYGGQLSGDPYNSSPTLLLHGPPEEWVGNIVFNDNHVETLASFFSEGTVYQPKDGQGPSDAGPPRLENIYAAEFADFMTGNGQNDPRASGDAWMGIFSGGNRDIALPRFDQLVRP